VLGPVTGDRATCLDFPRFPSRAGLAGRLL
jgi:hypothetical protein